jgi:hypothetical protein
MMMMMMMMIMIIIIIIIIIGVTHDLMILVIPGTMRTRKICKVNSKEKNR